MGGEDKGLVALNARPMVEHVIARLRPQVGEMLISANRNQERYAALGFRVVPDLVGGYQGPLAGIASALQVATTSYVVTVPCDSPLIGDDLVHRLGAALVREDADVAVAHDGERTHPVFLMLKRSLLPGLLVFLEAGERKIDLWFARHRVALADFRDCPGAFVNVNSPDEHRALETRLRETQHIPSRAQIPILGIAAYSGTGKTTLLRKILPQLRAQGLRVAVVKHAHHSFDTDIPGKDSFELRKAGAVQMLVASRHRWALVTETGDGSEPRLEALLDRLDHENLDLILVEGFKAEAIPKIELHRPSLGHPLLCTLDRSIIAIASDAPLLVKPGIPMLDLNRPEDIAAFILKYPLDSPERRRATGAQARSRS